jgi:hypothetical protein
MLALASCLALASLTEAAQAQEASAMSPAPAINPELVALYEAWRAFAAPEIVDGLPDYGKGAMGRKAAALPGFKARLAAIDRTGWSAGAISDYRLIEAEMNGLDFHLRVLMPWARDPSFYATIFGEESDVPAHEGPSAQPNIDLFGFDWPLSRADDKKLTLLLGAVPKLLTQAKSNLADGNAHDLFAYGDRAFKDQSAVLDALGKGTLTMRTLGGKKAALMTGASPALRKAIGAAKTATDDFARWVAAEAPKKTGPSGVGKENYNWYEKHVALNPYDWDAQAMLLQRELDRALASLALEETRNRALPPIAEISDPTAYRAMALARTARFNALLIATGLMPDKPYFRAAMEAQTSNYTPAAERAFFDHGTALDPLPLLSHSSHWIELARIKYEPHPDPIRRAAPLYNIFADRSEGFATAFEEIVMQTGLYDAGPRSREIVWIMLANRAARGLASLHVQANEMTLEQAGRFHAQWTPRHWSDANSPLVGFEQLLYLRQPGYGPSYILGKLQLDELLALAAHEADQAGRPFVLKDSWARIMSSGILPPSLIKAELFPGQGVR